jgi:predicted Zn-ribbon and HTH transcriptional regulator
MTRRQDLLALLAAGPRSASFLARALGVERRDIEDELRHAIRTARAAGVDVRIEPARCKGCGFLFAETRLLKPGRCPRCKGSRIFEPQIGLGPAPPE